MQQRIPVSDSRLAARIERVVADLEKYYPDHLVSRVATDHKHLDERITRVYRDAGYESRAAFYEAYGFKVSKMGRPRSSSNVEGLIATLEMRYEGKPKPVSIGDLRAQNPDLVGKLKTFSNNAKALTGKTAAAYLEERGILDNTSNDSSVRAMNVKKAAAAFDQLVSKLESKAAEDLPKTAADLRAGFPAQAGAVDFAVQRGFGDADLAAIGLLGCDGRGAPVRIAELGAEVCSQAGVPLTILPESNEAKHLPPYVAGIDVAANCELCERTVFVKGEDSVAGGDAGQGVASALLAAYEGSEVLSRGIVGNTPYAFVRVRAMRSLRRDTLIWLLRDAGILNDADLRGGMGWRWRLMRHGGANPFDQASN